MQNTKIWYSSWTVWFNVVLAVIAFLQTLSGIIPMSPNVMAAIAIAGNFLLRFKTSTGLSSSQR